MTHKQIPLQRSFTKLLTCFLQVLDFYEFFSSLSSRSILLFERQDIHIRLEAIQVSLQFKS